LGWQSSANAKSVSEKSQRVLCGCVTACVGGRPVQHLGCQADADSSLNLCTGRLVLAPSMSVVMRMPSGRAGGSRAGGSPRVGACPGAGPAGESRKGESREGGRASAGPAGSCARRADGRQQGGRAKGRGTKYALTRETRL